MTKKEKKKLFEKAALILQNQFSEKEFLEFQLQVDNDGNHRWWEVITKIARELSP